MNRRTFLRALSALAASLPLLGFRSPPTKPREEPWNPDVLKQPGWIVAFGPGDDYTIRSVKLDGREIISKCFAVNETTGEVGCYVNHISDVAWDKQALYRGHVEIGRSSTTKSFTHRRHEIPIVIPQKVVDEAVEKAMSRLMMS